MGQREWNSPAPSNRRSKIQRQQRAAFSGGTREFWIVDLTARTIEVTVVGRPPRVYKQDETIPVSVLQGVTFAVADLFQN